METLRITADHKTHEARKDENGCYLFKHLQVQDMLEYLMFQGAIKHSHIVIIAGRTADRGTSYVSRRYMWHLTHEYLLLGVDSSSTASSQIQALRICGVSNDDLPRTLITTQQIVDNCRAAMTIQDTWIDSAYHNVDVDPTPMHDVMHATRINPQNKVNCKLSRFPKYKQLLKYEEPPQHAIAPAAPQEIVGIRLIVAERLQQGTITRALYDSIVTIIQAMNTENWIHRGAIINKILEDENRDQRLRTRAQLQADMKNIHLTQTVDAAENTPGLLMKKTNNRIYYKLN
jgi:hypothetical protein